jgi:hypothetical protein
MSWWDVTFWDHYLWAEEAMMDLDRNIHSILFLNVEYHWADFCQANGLSLEEPVSSRWRNCKCDVQAMWAHIWHKRDVFVTIACDFHKKKDRKTN